jgi:hypothetical protein
MHRSDRMAQRHSFRCRWACLNRLQDAHRDERTILAILAFLTVWAARHVCRHRHVHHTAHIRLRDRRRSDQRGHSQTYGHEDRETEFEEPTKIHRLLSHEACHFKRPPPSHVSEAIDHRQHQKSRLVRDHLSPPSIAVRLKPLSNNDSGCHSGKLSNAVTPDGTMPANVSDSERAIVAAGFAKDVEAVNQQADVM